MPSGSDERRPALKPWYRLATCHEGVTARFGESTFLFEGKAACDVLPALLPLLDGSRSCDQLAAALGPTVHVILDALERHGLLLAEPGVRSRTEELLDATSLRLRRPAACSVGVFGDGQLARDVRRALRRSEVRVSREWDADLVVAADVPEALRRWNGRAVAGSIAFLPVTPFDGSIAAVGPLVVPRESPCYACFVLRRHGDPYAAVEDSLRSYYLSSPAIDSLLAGLAAGVAITWLTGGDAPALGAVLAYEYATQTVSRHTVLRVPRCPVCALASAPVTPWGSEHAAA